MPFSVPIVWPNSYLGISSSTPSVGSFGGSSGNGSTVWANNIGAVITLILIGH